MPFRTSEYALKYRFTRDRTPPMSHVSVSIGFDTPKRWTTLTLDYIAGPLTKPFSRWDEFLWHLGVRRRHEFSRSVTVVDATKYFQPKPESTDIATDKTDA